MGRAERRRLEREKSKQKTATYNLTWITTGKRPMQRRYQSLQSWYYSTMNAGKMES